MLKKEFLLENLELIKKLYIDENCTKKELAIRFNCSTSALERFFKEHNIFKRKTVQFKDLPSKEEVQKLLDKGLEYSEICETLNISNTQLAKILEIGKFSNKINEEILDNNVSLLWYLLGIISSDGHNSTFNQIDIFQKDGTYLNCLKKLLDHNGTLYKNADGYVLRLNSKKLSDILNAYDVQGDKRYTIPYMKAPTLDLESCYIRGLFDGDGCIYYNYVSGSFKHIRMEITTGSKNMINGLENLYKRLELSYALDTRISKEGNEYYVIYVRTFDDMIKFGNWIYSNSFTFRLSQKYIKFLKFLKLVELNKEVEDIVDTN